MIAVVPALEVRDRRLVSGSIAPMPGDSVARWVAISRIATREPEEDLRIHSGCGGGHDTTAGIPAVIEESSGGTTVYYIREPGGELIARVHPAEGIRYYHFDELGSTRLLTDANGTVTDRYAYDAYGSLLSHDRYTGSVDQPYQYVGRLGYYTHWMEPDFALLQLGVRFYDAQVGRFTQSSIRSAAVGRPEVVVLGSAR